MDQTLPKHPPNRFSPTGLETYARCPRRFEFQYVERVEAEETPSAALVLGAAVHQALAWLYRLPVQDRNEHAAHRLLRRAWARTERAGAFLGDEEEAEWGHRALRMLSRYCSRYALHLRPLAVEEWVRADLPNQTTVFGKADRIDVARGGTGIEVVDYKTGASRLEDGRDLANDPGAQVYALAATRSLGRRVTRVRFIYLAEDRELRWDPEPEDLASVKQRLTKRINTIVQDSEFPPTPGFGCRWCPYAPICDARDQAPLDDDSTGDGALPF